MAHNSNVVFLCWAVMCSIGRAHTPSGYFSTDNRDLYIQMASQSLVSDVETVHYAVALLSTLEAQVPDKVGACGAAQFALRSSSSDLSTIYFGASVNQALNCGAVPSSHVTELLARRASELRQEMDVIEAYYLIECTRLTSSSTEPLSHLSGFVEQIVQLQHSDGSFATALDTGFALSALAALAQFQLSEEPQQLIEELCGRLQGLIEGSYTSDNTAIRFFSPNGASVYATSLVTRGIIELGTSVGVGRIFSQEQLGLVAQYLLNFRQQSAEQPNLKQAASVASGLSLLNQHQVTTVTVQNELGLQLAANPGAERLLRLKVTDLFGKPTDCSVTATSVVAGTSDKQVASELSFVNDVSSGSSHSLDLLQVLSADPKPEVYVLALRVSTESEAPLTVERIVKVLVSCSVPSVQLRIGQTKDDAPHGSPIELRHGGDTGRIELAAGQWLQTQFEIHTDGPEQFRPHQVLLRFANVQSGLDVVIAPKWSAGNLWKALISADELSAALRHTQGQYTLSLLVGDVFVQPPLDWKLADLRLLTSAAEPAALQDTPQLEPLPLLEHLVEAEAEARPPALVAVIVTALCLVPIGLFVRFAFDTLNLDNFPNMQNSPYEFSIAVAFQGSIALFTLINLCYWLGLNLATAFRYIVPVACLSIGVGQRVCGQ